MSSEQLLSELDKMFKKDEQYRFLKYISANTGVFISAISIISAIVLFSARAISFIIVRVKYRFWNLDEGFLVEDNKAFLKLGVYALFFIFLTLLTTFAKRYVYRWELYNCELYLYDRIIKHQYNKLKNFKKEINRTLSIIESINDPVKEDRLNETIQLKKEYFEIKKDCTAIKKKVWRIRINLLARLLSVMLVVYFASIMLQLFSGVDNWDNGIVSLVASTGIMTLIIMFTAFFCAYIEIKITIKVVLKRSLKNKKIDWGSDCIIPVTDWLESKIAEQKNQTIKVLFSDISLKTILLNVIFTTAFLTVFLQFNVNYSLKRMNTFYVFREDQQDYVMLINDGTKYIFSGCDINDNKIIINTNKTIVRNDPVSLEKIQFESVERKP